MRNAFTIARREIESYFLSPIAYVTITVFLFISGFLFERILYLSREATLQYLFLNMGTILMFLCPLISMRLLSEEVRSGTIELLLTSPVRDWQVVIGKYLAALAFFAIALLLTGIYAAILAIIGSPDWGPILSGYLGVLLFGAALLSIGVFTSSWTRNQIIAAVAAIVLILFLWVIDALAGSTANTLTGVVSYLSLSRHFDDFMSGIIDTRHIVYYLSIIVVSLFLATRNLESRRWR